MIKESKPISIVMACDEGYAMPLATALRSITESNPQHWPLSVYILTHRFPERKRSKIRMSLPDGSASLSWLDISLNHFSGFLTLTHTTHMTFARFLLGDVLPKEIQRVLYLDSDLLVLGELGSLWRTSLEGYCAAAVPDLAFNSLQQRQDPECAGMPLVKRYFNAGVLLIDLDRWRRQRIGERAVQYLYEHPDSPYADQDALNVVLDGSWKVLAEAWNFQPHYNTNLASMKPDLRPVIVHFVSNMKPWRREFHTPNERLFDYYRRRTQFSRSLCMRILDSSKTTWFLVKQVLKRCLPTSKM